MLTIPPRRFGSREAKSEPSNSSSIRRTSGSRSSPIAVGAT